MAADQHSSGAPWRNFYGRFKGKTLRPGQEEALESDLAQLSLGPVSWTENPDRSALDLTQAVFSRWFLLSNLVDGVRDLWRIRENLGFGNGAVMS